MSPRPRKNSINIPGLYARFDRRTDKTYYQYKNPVTGKFHGLGTDKAKAEKIAITANQRIASAEAEYFLKKIDETLNQIKTGELVFAHGLNAIKKCNGPENQTVIFRLSGIAKK